MAVRVVPQQVTCPKCSELLEYTMADVKKKEKTERYSIPDDSKGGNRMIPYERTIEIWTIKCPSCGEIIQVGIIPISGREL
jgi:C4-type Zn-finger protein